MSFAAEDQLILQCSRVKLDEQAISMASNLLRQTLDWDYILEVSILHGVAPLLCHGLAQLALVTDTTTLVPRPVQQELDRLYLNNAARNRRLYRVVGEICGAFERADLPVIALKDLALAKTVFPDMALRPMGDVDLLIRRKDCARIEQCMAGLGFTPVPSPNCPYILKYAWGLHFHRAADNVWVDVQWGVLQLEWDAYGEGNFDFEIERLWNGAQALTIDDFQIMIPKPEDMLFHLCMHLEGHRYAELILLCDIAELIRHYSGVLDWSYLIALAKKYGVEASLYYMLSITWQLLDCPLPLVLEQLAPGYYKANLFEPLYGNLTDLHVALDDIHRAASPPPATMADLETVVRRQAACAMRLYQELDQLATAAKNLGATVVIWDGASPQRIFPSQALDPFPAIQLFVLDQDHSKLGTALSTCGFEAARASDTEVYDKRRVFESRDPATGHVPLTLEIQGRVIHGVRDVLRPGAPSDESKKTLALKALHGALQPDRNSLAAKVKLDLIVASPEEMVLCLAARLGQREHERLFGACSLLEFFRGYTGSVDWQQVASIAGQYDMKQQAYTGLLIANRLLNEPIAPGDLSCFNGSVNLPRVLQWARYGPESLELYTRFKALYFCVFGFLSVRGLRSKLAYLVKGQVIVNSLRYALGLAAQWLTIELRAQKHLTARDLAYWTEPEPLSETLAG